VQRTTVSRYTEKDRIKSTTEGKRASGIGSWVYCYVASIIRQQSQPCFDLAKQYFSIEITFNNYEEN
jgi:hypothetical protein